ncbi:hypothetical protein E0G79_21985 [Salmonella enterica]|nr:hypothetical protein [Salmonella enterica]EBA9765493.1 hypothetical protein [Salmonella enterica]EGX5147491.1 hypothetical protein [Salmonella enterica]
MYSREQLVRTLSEYPRSPVILGISPHEHVAALYRLQGLLSGRPVLFVARYFWWTDYRLPTFAGITLCRFCTLDSLSDARARQTEIRRFKQLQTGALTEYTATASESTGVTSGGLLKQANFWLYEQMTIAGLSRTESMVLLLLSENQRGNLPARLLSLYKISGLRKLGMTGRAVNLYRGIRLRRELQAQLPSQNTDHTVVWEDE